jgi:hypothetical protein
MLISFSENGETITITADSAPRAIAVANAVISLLMAPPAQPVYVPPLPAPPQPGMPQPSPLAPVPDTTSTVVPDETKEPEPVS